VPEPAELIGPYRLVSQLGKGAMGEVWRARDERLDRYVALKVLPAELAHDPERRARIQREAKAAAAIRHANVVTLYDIVDHAGGDILVMELVEGRTLSEVLRKDGAPPRETALRWIEQIADALAAAHARRILHRDIKAANIMVTPDGHIKVLDFGLAKLHDGAEPMASLRMMKLPSASNSKIALDETMPSQSNPDLAATREMDADFELNSYETHAGTLLGTPLYMAPEQIAGSAPDERSEVFSVGVLAYELVAGKPPYTATTMDALFDQILKAEPAFGDIPEPVATILRRALAKEPKDRFASMAALRDALVALHRPPTKIWPFAAAGALVVAAVVVAIAMWPAAKPQVRPGDEYVTRALEEYDVFYNDKALSSLRAALRIAPQHPRANAYMVLFGGAPEADRAAAVQAAHVAVAAEHSKDKALLEAAIAYAERGAQAAKEALVGAGAPSDRELEFWASELDYRAGHYETANGEYKALLASPAPGFRGRIYDHESSVLLYLDEPAEALRIGTLYRDAFPGEADAVGVYATTLAAAGKLDEAVAAAEDAVRLNEGEDTLAGLAKVLALKAASVTPIDPATLGRAIDLYKQSLERAGATRRPIRRAALGLLQWLRGDKDAYATVAPCVDGEDAHVAERGMCLFVAGLMKPTPQVVAQLEELAAAATPTKPAYGSPASLAKLVGVAQQFAAGGCVSPAGAQHADGIDERVYDVKVDFYGAYHVPFFATYAVCEHAALLKARGDEPGAQRLLDAVAHKAPGRAWLRLR
jgi:tetratricopeptide (TPR) repeat protein/predicted Ser/Thr protein kinase